MKNPDAQIHAMFGKVLDQQIKEDTEELILAEQKTGRKLKPAYIQEDLWQEQRRASILKRQV